MIRKISVSLLCTLLICALSVTSPVSGGTPPDSRTKKNLAERICGKYSCYDAANGEFETLSFVTFGDNLYAYAAFAYGKKDQKEPLESYSYLAEEFIPDDKKAMTDTDSDSVKVNALCFSNMAMLSKYQGDAAKGTIQLTKDGLILDGFGSGKKNYKRDDRVEDAFIYLDKKGSAGNRELQGYWRLTKADYPIYLFFDGTNMYIYEKLPGTEVSFYAGACSASGNRLSGTLSNLVSAGMPYDLKAKYAVKKDALTITEEADSDLGFFGKGDEFERIEKRDVPVITAKGYITPDLDPNADPDSLYAADPDLRPFYGVIVSSTKDREAAIKAAKKLCDKGYDASVTYTPEWESFNKDPYFVVLAGRYDTKGDAEALLKDVKKGGFKDAYVKYSGQSKGIRINYTTFSPSAVSIRNDSVVIRFSDPTPTYDWSPYYEENGYDTGSAYLYLDKDTVFDKSCVMASFVNYKKGDNVLEWFQKNKKLIDDDFENAVYDAWLGVFDVNVYGNYIDNYYGIYWWD